MSQHRVPFFLPLAATVLVALLLSGSVQGQVESSKHHGAFVMRDSHSLQKDIESSETTQVVVTGTTAAGDVFSSVPVPGLFGLRLQPDGSGARIGFARIGGLDGRQALWRVAAEADIGFLNGSLRGRLGVTTDPWERGELDEGLGGGDLRTGLGWRWDAIALGSGWLRAQIDADLWLPTGDAPNSVDVVRASPSLSLALQNEFIALRTRQGFAVDLGTPDQGGQEVSWVAAYGVDASFRASGPGLLWGIGAELQSATGHDEDFFLRLTAGAQFFLRWFSYSAGAPPLQLGIGLRRSLSDDAQALIGDWTLAASLRVFTDTAASTD